MTMDDADPGDPVLTGDEIRNVRFGKGIYDASQVNALLDRIAAELDAGRPAGPLIANARFRRLNPSDTPLPYTPRASVTASPIGYDTGAVDWLLEQLRRREDPAEAARTNADPRHALPADPYCIRREPGDLAGSVAAPSKQECLDAWRDFAQQPGTRLWWVRAGALRDELRTADQRAVASARRGLFTTTFTAGGRTFTWKRVVNLSSLPDIAETVSPGLPNAPAHLLQPQADDTDFLPMRWLFDQTGMPILYTGGSHYDGSADGYIKLPGFRWLRFPVRGTRQTNAIMTAVDQAGNRVARYRLHYNETGFRKRTEITVHPGHQLTDELALAIAYSADWLRSYFDSAAGL